MIRKRKKRLDYFSLDVDFFQNVKVRKIKMSCGTKGISVLLCLLCNLYRDEGYYILWDEDLPFLIADQVGVKEKTVLKVIRKAIQVNFFDRDMAEQKIITSQEIQKRYVKICKTLRRQDYHILPEYNLITPKQPDPAPPAGPFGSIPQQDDPAPPEETNGSYIQQPDPFAPDKATVLSSQQDDPAPPEEITAFYTQQPDPAPPEQKTQHTAEKNNKTQLVLPFQTQTFESKWQDWKAYKRSEFQFRYKSTQSEQAALSNLARLSGQDESRAVKIIENSMANGWKGFFELSKQHSIAERKGRVYYTPGDNGNGIPYKPFVIY